MQKLKVKTIFGAHQIYQEIVNNPPKNVKYLGVKSATTFGKYYEKKKWKEKINEIMQKMAFPRMVFIKPGNYNLIHSSRGIIPLNGKPWVIDIEQFTSFIGLHFDLMTKNKFLRWIVGKNLASENCKKIMCHCEATKQSFLKYFNSEKFNHKLEVLYPSSHLIPIKKNKNKKVRILAILSLFEQKGGNQILEAFSYLEKKYDNIELLMRADVSEKIEQKYNSKNIIFQKYFSNIVPREKLLKEVYSQADIFVYTTFCDSFGYNLIDGLVAGLPMIGTNLFAVPEVIEDGKNGFIINIPGYNPKSYIQEYPVSKLTKEQNNQFVKNLANSLEKLIKNKKLREKMGMESYNLINKGKFSIIERNKKLLKIYEGAIE